MNERLPPDFIEKYARGELSPEEADIAEMACIWDPRLAEQMALETAMVGARGSNPQDSRLRPIAWAATGAAVAGMVAMVGLWGVDEESGVNGPVMPASHVYVARVRDALELVTVPESEGIVLLTIPISRIPDDQDYEVRIEAGDRSMLMPGLKLDNAGNLVLAIDRQQLPGRSMEVRVYKSASGLAMEPIQIAFE